jgi:hypothetical protein
MTHIVNQFFQYTSQLSKTFSDVNDESQNKNKNIITSFFPNIEKQRNGYGIYFIYNLIRGIFIKDPKQTMILRRKGELAKAIVQILNISQEGSINISGRDVTVSDNNGNLRIGETSISDLQQSLKEAIVEIVKSGNKDAKLFVKNIIADIVNDTKNKNAQDSVVKDEAVLELSKEKQTIIINNLDGENSTNIGNNKKVINNSENLSQNDNINNNLSVFAQSNITQIEEKNKMVNDNKKQLHFSATTGMVITLTINMNETTVGEVKELVAKLMGTTADRIRLIAGSDLLIDNNALMPNEHDKITIMLSLIKSK